MSILSEWASTIIAVLTGLLGIGIIWGKTQERLKSERVEVERLYSIIKHLQEGDGGKPVYMTRDDCKIFHETCRGIRCAEILDIKRVLAEHSNDIRAFRNFAFWSLSSKEGLPLSEVTRILELGNRE